MASGLRMAGGRRESQLVCYLAVYEGGCDVEMQLHRLAPDRPHPLTQTALVP